MSNDNLGDRMKEYEDVTRVTLPRRIPVIIRLDGRAFHTVTKKMGMGKKWHKDFTYIMAMVTNSVMKEIQGCMFAYCQSDEISFLLTDYKTIRTEAWFGYDLRKMVSITAAVASAAFCHGASTFIHQTFGGVFYPIMFDSRAFSIPQDDVCNYFIWRQQDATRNAISMAGREYFSHKELHKKSCEEIQEMLWQKHKINFNDYPVIRKRGFCVIKKDMDDDIPIFTQNRHYVEQFVNVRED